jgi:uncharacterized phage-associated protein
MKKAAIILVWIGRLPSYFPLWVRSLEKNSSFDFLLFTDQTVEEKIPENLKIIGLTIRDLADIISKKLSLRVEILYPYKICDFKPAFGEIFNDYLGGYAFWGCCDLDLMFGNLSKFITDDILASYKKVLVRGHLTLYRNEPVVNAAYRSSKTIDYKKIFESQSYCLFDEWMGIYQIFKELDIDQYQEEIMVDIKVGSARYVCTHVENNFSRQIFVWEDGEVKQYYLTNGKLQYREFAYVHYQKRKIVIGDAAVHTSPAIILNSHSFLSFSGKITPATVKKYDTPNYGHYLNFQLKRIKKKLIPAGNNSILFDKSVLKKSQ